MSIQHSLAAAALAAVLGGLILPALAQAPGGTDGMMGGGCAGMMQSMNGGDGRPNSQWRSHPQDGRAAPD